MTRADARTGYSPALDGLRALAVGAVVVYHFAPGLLPAGFLGVDVFFVVSGFLITRILATEIGAGGGVRLRAFWARRVRRLLPALALLVVVVIATAAALSTALERRGLPAQTVGTLTFSVNWVLIAQSGDYFATVGRPSPLLHLWSLAIEEQFYVVLPLALFAARRHVRQRPGAVAAVAVASAVASTIAMAVVAGAGAGISRAYLGTMTHASGLLVGVALGLGADRWAGRIRPGAVAGAAASGAGVLLAATMVFADDRSLGLYRGGFLAFAALTALVVAVVVARPDSVPARLLAVGPLVALGVRSYALYLWHWPVRVFVEPRPGLDGVALFAARLALSLVLAELSFRLVERPFRTGIVARRAGTRGAAVAYGAGGAVALLLALTVAAPAATPPRTLAGGDPAPPGARRIDLFGDSTALVFGLAGRDRADELGISVGGAAELGCGIVLRDHVSAGRVIPNPTRECGDIRTRWRNSLRADPDADLALMAGAWDILDQRVDGRTVRFGSEEWEALVADALRDALRLLTSDGRPVSLFQVPCFGEGDPAYPLPERSDRRRLAALDAIWARVAAEFPGVRLVRWRDIVCPDGERIEEIDGVEVWEPDGVHLTPDGAEVVWRWWLPQLPPVSAR